ncbi:site-specific integrase [Paenibacillus sp. MZ04-78.2]|uniref:site-specific integrase n=1 Tax=Paenibacillus sp. MZ04-78.2 TaxID=2962034 RepID=UPI0020B85DA8|nr:site-specific integrase [Paenibacillus sp. MZ04-78.2]MCP3776696.1 site-specific integrase [Paenibacillus sp. MZ04-78.2]
MEILPFRELMIELEKELYRLHYNEQSIKYYRLMWRRIAGFLESEGTNCFTEEAGIRFLERKYNYFELEKAGNLTQSIINVSRVVRMLGDYQLHGCILRRYFKQKKLLQSTAFEAILKKYSVHCEMKDYSRATQNHYRKATEKFLSFLESKGIPECAVISAVILNDYINTLLGYSCKMVEQQLCALRSFLRFLYSNQIHTQDLTETLPSINARKQNRIPSVWSPEHVTKLLEAIDRGNPAGKRDYAMILSVARLGLRSIDLKRLKLENLKWQENRITLMQSKTSRELYLPLLPDVGWAIIDYLKHGRPKVDSPFVFLRHLAPLEPFSDEHHLHRIIEKYMKLAKIPISPQKKRGMHSLRHTLASRLLQENTPLSVISDILGHVSSDSTAVYLKVDVEMLRECALNPEGVLPHA